MNDFNITFFGVGGSSSTSSENRRKYGNNTSCALVRAGDNFIILDMGSGAVQLSNLAGEYGMDSADVLLSHFHYDHIEGIPFFMPFYSGGKFTVYSELRPNPTQPNSSIGAEEIFCDYMKQPFFPVTPSGFSKGLRYCEFRENEVFMLGENIRVETMHANHAGLSTIYKIIYDGRSLVYMLDHEHTSLSIDGDIADFCSGADLVVYDAHFTKEEYDSGRYYGWGHSTYEEGISLAKEANIKKIAFAHYALWRTDEELDVIKERVTAILPTSIMAKEGLMVEI